MQRAEPCSATQWCHPFSARARGLLGARLVTRYANCASTRRCSCPSVLLAWKTGVKSTHTGPGYSQASWVCSRGDDGVYGCKCGWVFGCLPVGACVCVHACVLIHIAAVIPELACSHHKVYGCMYLCISMYLRVFLCVCLYVCVCSCVMYVFTYLSLCICLCIRGYMSVAVWVNVLRYVNIPLSAGGCVCACECVCV